MLKIEKITNDVTYIGALDPNLKTFDIVMETKFGTTYNSYLIDGGSELALIETAKEKYFDEYFENLKSICDISKIKYLIVNHTEPDHTGEIHKLLEKIPNLTIVGTPTALGFLRDIVNKDFKKIEVITNTKIKFGNKELEFIPAPNLHWPDSMFTYLKSESLLFTCDVFGAHYSTKNVYNDLVENKADYMEAFKYYHDAIFSPFSPFVISGLEKIKNLNLKMICPSHGPVLRSNLDFYKEKYLDWAKDVKVKKGKISIIYTSAYGYTQKLATQIKKGIEKQHLDVTLVDLEKVTFDEAIFHIKSSEGFLIGSPTINSDVVPPIWQLLSSLSPYDHCGKLTAAFGAYGWSGEAVNNIESRLSMLKTEVLRPGLKIKFNPENKVKLKKAYNFGEKFAKKFIEQKRVCDTDEWVEIKTGKWKCLICGEIYEGEYPPQSCPACGAPADQFIEIVDEKITFKSNYSKKIVIIGGSIAAVSAIEAIRKRNTSAKIVMLSREDVYPYNKILFSKNLLCDNKISYLKEKSWYEKNNVEVKLSKNVFRIDANSKKVICQDSEIIEFDRLIIATGAKNNKIPIHGDDKKGVFSLREKSDFDKLTNYAKQDFVKNVVLIGGGILGVEMASSLAKCGKNISIIEYGPRLMAKQLDEDAAKIFHKHLEENKIKIYLNETVEEILSTKGRVCAVNLAHSREKIKADLIITSTGIKTDLSIIDGTNISKNRGILVNEYMQTNHPNIFACGDIAEFRGKTIGLYSIAIEQGKVAGANAVGDRVKYSEKPISTSFNGFNYKVFSIGDLGFDKEKVYQILELSDIETENYRKFYFLNYEFVGGILMGDTSKAIQLRKAIDKKSTMQHFLDKHFLDE